VNLWRIATETRLYRATDLTGAGAAKFPGRWNDDGEPVVYAATSIALATLETAAHVDPGGLPLNRFLIELHVPDDVWEGRVEFTVKAPPRAWNAVPAGRASIEVGSRWLQSASAAIATVPSVIVPEESVALINPRHPNAARIVPSNLRRFEYDVLFRAHPP
jgi:RES domain-containing protein